MNSEVYLNGVLLGNHPYGYTASRRKAWQGRCMVIIKSDNQSGDIILRASSEGLVSSSITINCK